MKKVLAMVFALSLSACAFVSCGDSDGSNESSKTSESANAYDQNDDDETADDTTAAAEGDSEEDNKKYEMAAHSLMLAAQSTLMDMDAEGMDISGKQIVSSNMDYVEVTDGFEYFWLNAHIKEYFADIDKFEYIMLIEDGTVKYTAVAEVYKSDVLGINGETDSIADCKTFQEIMDIASK